MRPHSHIKPTRTGVSIPRLGAEQKASFQFARMFSLATTTTTPPPPPPPPPSRTVILYFDNLPKAYNVYLLFLIHQQNGSLTIFRYSIKTMAESGNDGLGDLGKLPAEIRNEVYKLCLISKNAVRIARVVTKKKQRVYANTPFGPVLYTKPQQHGLRSSILKYSNEPVGRAVSFSLLFVSK